LMFQTSIGPSGLSPGWVFYINLILFM
jgi:hypothetical protein